MNTPKSLKTYIDELFCHFNYGDLHPSDANVKTQFNPLVSTENIFWKKYELTGEWERNWSAIQTSGPGGHGLLVFFSFSGDKILARINNGIEGGNFIGEKAKTDLELTEAYLDHQKAADWFFQIIDQCIRYNFSGSKQAFDIK